MRFPLLAVAALGLASASLAQITPEEMKGIEEALYVGNMTLRDLEIPREPASEPYALPFAGLALANPIEGVNSLMAMHAAGGGSLAANLAALSSRVLGDRIGEGQPFPPPEKLGREVPEALRRPLGSLAAALREANGTIRKALSGLSATERRALLEALPGWASEDPSLKPEFVTRPQPPASEVEAMLARVDLRAIRLAARRLVGRLGQEVRALQAAARLTTLDGTITLNVDGMILEISGQGDDRHVSRNATLCVDLGGNDVYTGRYGAGVGYAAILIDLGGDDRYEVPDLSHGAGLLGVGIACDFGAGGDVYRSRTLAFGAGLGGVGAAYDGGGRDEYRSTALTQGFGALGMGALLDMGGDDAYTAGAWAQGAGRTGGAGWLADAGGDDIYRATGRGAQGCGMGKDGRGGGAGLLTDLGGSDAYRVTELGQATGMAGSLGSLYDASGDDDYFGGSRVQGVASGAVAALFDLDGNDVYLARRGSAPASAGFGGVAFVLDRAGDDMAVARMGTPGAGTGGGLAFFVDAVGDDTYSAPAGRGFSINGGGLSLFADLSVRQEDFLVGDERVVENPRRAAYPADPPRLFFGIQVVAPEKRPDAAPPPSPADFEAEFSRAASGDSEALARLLGIGLPAFDWMLSTVLPRPDDRGLSVVAQVAARLGTEAGIRLSPLILGADETAARNALEIVALAGVRGTGPAVLAALERPSLQRYAVRAAATLNLGEATSMLSRIAIPRDPGVAREAFFALAIVGDESGLELAQARVDSPVLPERKAAVAYLARFPQRSMGLVRSLLTSQEERKVRTGLEILQRMGSDEAIRLAAPFLGSAMPGARIGALLALEGRCPPEVRPEFMALRRDPHPLVRAVALGLDPRR